MEGDYLYMRKCILTLSIIITIISITLSAVAADTSFNDVSADVPFYEDIERLAEMGAVTGYDDGTFRPDSDMTRAEAAAIFARLIAEDKGEKVSGKNTFADVNKNAWYYDYVGYLAKYDIINGYTDGTFKPDESVTRAEFVAMAVRYYGLFNEVKNTGYTVKYTDLDKNYWAYNDIALAKNIGWLNGYADGTFRGDNNITRAEVVTIVNRATGRMADKEYVKDNLTKLNRFTDVTNSNLWYFMDVHEAANTHMANIVEDAETWVK